MMRSPLHVAELLCRILHDTEIRTAVRAQRVCKSWRDHIKPMLVAVLFSAQPKAHLLSLNLTLRPLHSLLDGHDFWLHHLYTTLTQITCRSGATIPTMRYAGWDTILYAKRASWKSVPIWPPVKTIAVYTHWPTFTRGYWKIWS